MIYCIISYRCIPTHRISTKDVPNIRYDWGVTGSEELNFQLCYTRTWEIIGKSNRGKYINGSDKGKIFFFATV